MTRRALVTILVALALLLIAATIRSGWLYLVSSVLFALVLIALISGWLATRSVEVDRRSPSQVFEREPFDVEIEVKNRGRMSRRLLTVTDVQFPRARRTRLAAKIRAQRAEFKEFMRTGKAPPTRREKRDESARTVVIEDLPGRSHIDVSYSLQAPKRGVYAPSEMRVSSGGVFGSGRVGHSAKVGSPMIAFPEISAIESFSFDPKAEASSVEPVEWSRKGIGQDYYGTREYVRGDSLRHIHWRSSARQRELIVKEYEQELKPSVAMVLALWEGAFGTADDNSLEDGLRAAASLISLQESMGALPLLILPDGTGFSSEEYPTLYACLEALARYAPLPRALDPSSTVAAALETARDWMLPNTALVTVTNAPPDGVRSALEADGWGVGGNLVMVIDDAYGPGWRDEWLEEAPWLAGFVGMDIQLHAVTPGRGIGTCLSEVLNTTA